MKTALLQSARDKSVEIYKSFQQVKGKNSKIRLKQCCIRFDERSFAFAKATTKITPYWLHLSLSGKRGRTAFPVVFGERKALLEQAIAGHYSIKNVEMKKRAGVWYAHLTLNRTVELPDTPKTVIGLDRDEKNFAVAVSLHQDRPAQPQQGTFWSGAEIKALQGKYHHIRRNLGRKKLPYMIKKITGKLARKTDHALHKLANEIVAYVTQFETPMIVMENLTQLRTQFQKDQHSKQLNRRMNSLLFRKLQTYIEYKALHHGIRVRYINPKDTTKECHRCGTMNQVGTARQYHCANPTCNMTYDRDLNASINIAQRITSSLGWGTRGCPAQPHEASFAKA